MEVERKPAADWPHWPDRENGQPRRDRLEGRLFRDSEREAELARVQETIRVVEEAVTESSAQLDRLEQAVDALDGAEQVSVSYLVFACSPGGYALHDARGDLPSTGGWVSVNGVEYRVAKVAASPLPGDPRRCAYLEPR